MYAIPSEKDYIGLYEPSSEDSIPVLNLKQTELRLGLPGFDYPERKLGSGISVFGRDLKEERHNEEFEGPLKSLVSGAKRGFSDALNGYGKWALCVNGGSEVDLEKNNSFFYQKGCKTSSNLESYFAGSSVKEIVQHVKEKKNEAGNAAAPAAKAQVVGWPPVRSFRKNTLATNSPQNSSNNTAKSGSCSCLFVKVSMDGAPYLRKIDLKTYSSYAQLSSALEKMFSCFTIGQYEQGFEGQERLSDNFLVDLLHGCEYVLTYEDKDGDWMLVGDVPWEMFTDSCKRLRIMKGSEAIGLAPRTMHKCKRQN